jgi:predicted transcriptional regulator
MPGKTISAYTDEETARMVGELAKAERRTPSQIAGEAIALYVRLPREAHASLREIGGDEEPARDLMIRQVARAIIRAAYDASLARMVPPVKEIYGDTLASEDDILSEAVRLTSLPRKGSGRRSTGGKETGAADAEPAITRRRAY